MNYTLVISTINIQKLRHMTTITTTNCVVFSQKTLLQHIKCPNERKEQQQHRTEWNIGNEKKDKNKEFDK